MTRWAAGFTTAAGAGNDAVYGHAGNDLLAGGSGNDYLYGEDGNDNLAGNDGSDRLSGGTGDDQLDGGTDNDWLQGDEGHDTYRLDRGSGADTIHDYDNSGSSDTLRFGPDVTADQLWFRRNGNELEVSIIGTEDRSTINGWYNGDHFHVEIFATDAGQILLDNNVDALVSAMASFAPSASGQTTLPTQYQATLQPQIAASWN